MMTYMLLNFIGFNISWFGLIFFGESFIPLAFLWLVFHIFHCKKTIAELKLILSITFIGVVVDSTLMFAGVFIFDEQFIIPMWLITLWAVFAATIAHSLQFLARSKLLQFTVGYIFPPISYLGGASLSAVEFGHNSLVTFFILASLWGVLMVLFFHIKEILYFQEADND